MRYIPFNVGKLWIGRDRTVSKQYKDELGNELVFVNIRRDRALSFILILIVCVILSVSIITLDTQVDSVYISIASHPIHILLLLISIAFIVFTSAMKHLKIKNTVYLGAAHLVLNLLVLALCAIIGVENELAGQRPMAYITAMFCIGSVVLMPASYRFCVFFLPWGIYQTAMLQVVPNKLVVFQNFLFITMLMILAMLLSHINYASYASNFRNRKIVEEKAELDRLYRASEEKLQKSNEELKHTLEMERVRNAFFANISHELRTPLNVVFSAEHMLEYTLKRLPVQEKQEEISRYMRLMHRNSYRLLRIIDNLLDITVMDMGDFQLRTRACEIVSLVEDITLSVARYIEGKNISMTFDTEIEEKLISCDPDKIERIVLNLLSNATKFTPGGGSVYVSLWEEKGNIVLSVRDTGIGIPEEMTGLIFERFTQVDKTYARSREGSGLGLAIVKSLVEMHGGSISVDSRLGEGSEFLVRIPAAEPYCEGSEEGEPQKVSYNVERIKIEFSDIYD